MSRTSWGAKQTLLDILRSLGVKIDKKAEAEVIEERAQNPDMTTADILRRKSLAPQEKINEAIIIATKAGSAEVLMDKMTEATAAIRGTQQASSALSDVALAISKK